MIAGSGLAENSIQKGFKPHWGLETKVIAVRWRFGGVGTIEESRGSALFFNQKSDSLLIACQIIQNTGLDENLGILQQKKYTVSVEPKELLRLVMALSTCNLVQTMKADFIEAEFSQPIREEILREYILESFRKQDLVKLKGGDETEALRLSVMGLVKELEVFWKEEDDPQGSGPGPRYYCVKEVLTRVGNQPDYALHDALFELMYLQYKHYLKFFTAYLEQKKKKN